MIKKCCQEKSKLKRIEVLISKALNMSDVIKEISISEKEFTETNCKRLQKNLAYIENKNLIDSGGGMYLTTDSLIKTNNTMTSSNDITLWKVSVKPYRFDKTYMDKELI